MIKKLKKSYILNNIFKLSFANIILKIFGFVFITILLSKFTIESYGNYVLTVSYLLIIEIFSSFGLSNLIQNKIINNAKNIGLLYTMILLSIVFIVLFSVGLYLYTDISIVLISIFTIYVLLNNNINLLYFVSQMHTFWSKFIIVQGFIHYTFLISIIYLFDNNILDILLYGYIIKICTLIISILFYKNDKLKIYLKYKFKKKDISLFFRMIKKDGSWLIVNLLVNKLALQSIPIMIGEGLSVVLLGIFDIMLKIIAILQMPFYMMEKIIVSRVKSIAMLNIRNKYLKYLNIVSILTVVIGIISINIYMRYFIDYSYEEKYLILSIILSLTLATFGYRVFHRTYFTMNKMTKELFIINLISTVVHFGGMIFLLQTNYANIYSVGMLYLITSLVAFISFTYYFKRSST